MDCGRCGRRTLSTRMSIFNTDECCEDCIREEQEHPKYEEAKAAELAAVRAGNYNFPGIGLPEDYFAVADYEEEEEE